VRSNKVVIPYERLDQVNLGQFRDTHVIRLLPEQYFDAPGVPKADFVQAEARVNVGTTAFMLYRTHRSFEEFPPLPDWQVRGLQLNGHVCTDRKGGVVDTGHYVLRIPRHGRSPKRIEGPPQGIFAPEYADEETNYLCKCVLVWLTVHADMSPYTTTQVAHIRSILASIDIDPDRHFSQRGAMRNGVTCCPLCLRLLTYSELHDTVNFDDADGLENAANQIEGATRSTVVNLFHIEPLRYSTVAHVPRNVAWGHALCNTKLGQRMCYSLDELRAVGRKLAIQEGDTLSTFGWMSGDDAMIRSPRGAVWTQICNDDPDQTIDADEWGEEEE
jgi:hypothetical protein